MQFYDLAARVMDVSDQEGLIQVLTSENTGENQSLTTRLAPSTSTSPPRPPGPPSLVDTRLLGKPGSFTGDPQKYPDWSFRLRA